MSYEQSLQNLLVRDYCVSAEVTIQTSSPDGARVHDISGLRFFFVGAVSMYDEGHYPEGETFAQLKERAPASYETILSQIRKVQDLGIRI